jgi:hypothetical protein
MSSGLLRKYIDLFEQDKPFRVEVVDGPNIAFVGDSIAYGLFNKMSTGARGDAAVGLTSNAIANRVARNKSVQNANYAVVSAGTNDFATGKGDAAALEANLAAIRSSLKAIVCIWVGPYNPEANAVVKKFAKSQGDNFVDLNRYPVDSLGIHPRDYVSVINDLLRLGIGRDRDPQDKEPSLIDKKFSGDSEKPPNKSSGAPAPSKDTPSAEIEKTQLPGDIGQYKGRVKKLQQDFKAKFSRELPVTSQERTRAEQQDLYDRWRRGEKGIYTPVNPANQPGREIFHNTAIDVSPALSREEETWMNQQGWVRTMPAQDPVHYEYQGKWDEPAPSATPAAGADKNNKDNTVTPQGRPDLDKLGSILSKKIKEDSVDQLTPTEQMQFWQAVIIAEADAPRIEPTWDNDNWGSGFKSSAELADKYKKELDPPTASQPKIKIVKDGAGVAIVAPNGQRFPNFANSKEAMAWMEKDPANYKMVMGNAPTNWIGGTPDAEPTDSAEPKSKVRVFGKRSEPTPPVDPAVSPIKRDLNLKPLSSLNKVRQGMASPKFGKGATVVGALGALGAAGSYAYNKFRTQDLSDYPPEDQAYIKEMLPVIKGYYNNVDKFQSELDRNQQLQVIDYVNTLKKLPALKADFPQNTNWDIYIKTID